MPDSVATPLFMIRVKLPSSGGYASCPSGDSDYEADYSKSIRDAMPVGFEVQHQRINDKWAEDSEGFTLIPLRLVDQKASLAYWISKCAELKKSIATMKTVAKSISE